MLVGHNIFCRCLIIFTQVHEKLGLSYKNSKELNTIVDKLPTRPKFRKEEITISGQAFDVYHRDILECIQSLLGDPEFADKLKFAPEKHYTGPDRLNRVYSDVYTGKWWWKVQVSPDVQFSLDGPNSHIVTKVALEQKEPGATIIPVFISSDKTQLTLFRGKMAYPVYLTIGNIPKEIRRKPSHRGQILLAYLPTTKLEHIDTIASRRRALSNLYHACVRKVVSPLETAGPNGCEMWVCNGNIHRCHPLLAGFVSDYPEQLLGACCKYGTCPKCTAPPDCLGDGKSYPLRDLKKVLDALKSLDQGPAAYHKKCQDAGIKPVFHPFWENLKGANIFEAITSDILHQLYQGVVKHLVNWIKAIFGAAEIDARCRRLPPNHNLRHFSNGITTLSRITGQEHSDISRIILGLIIGMKLPGNHSPARLLRAVRSILDFLYLAQLPVHTSETLKNLQAALDTFHNNKSIFVDLGIRENFNIPKLHSLQHYVSCIESLGTTDNYNTESTERLHIDFAKDAYRATNHKDEYAQMTLWLERREKVLLHQVYINHLLSPPPIPNPPATSSGPKTPSPSHPCTDTPNYTKRIHITKTPSVSLVSFKKLVSSYGAVDFRQALTVFIASYKHPTFNRNQLQKAAFNIFLPFQKVPIFHKIKLWNDDPQDLINGKKTLDVIHCHPRAESKRGAELPARFDTALIDVSADPGSGVTGSLSFL